MKCGGFWRVRQADDLMPGGMQEIGDALAHESTSCDEYFHGWRFFW
jgi:hypothetical protein